MSVEEGAVWVRLYIAAKEAKMDYEQAAILGRDMIKAERKMYELNAQVRAFCKAEQNVSLTKPDAVTIRRS